MLCAKKKKAFTLIELLVVISIIALLLSILLPSLQRAKDMAASVVCKSNMRSLGLASLMYSNTYNDKMHPFYEHRNKYRPSDEGSTWHFFINPFVEAEGKPGDTVFTGGKLKTVFLCPGDKQRFRVTNDRTGSNYSYNEYLGNGWHFNNSRYNDTDSSMYRKRSSVPMPSEVVMIADGLYNWDSASGKEPFYYFQQQIGVAPGVGKQPNPYGSISFRHPQNRGVNLLFVDGSVRSNQGHIPADMIAYRGNGLDIWDRYPDDWPGTDELYPNE